MPCLDKHVQYRQHRIIHDQKASPTPGYVEAVEWDKYEGDGEQSDKTYRRDPQRRRKVNNVRLASLQDGRRSGTSNTKQEIEHRAAKARGVRHRGCE